MEDHIYHKIAEKLKYTHVTVATVIDGARRGEKFLLDSPKDAEKIGEEGEAVFSECVGREKQLVICGAGHVAIPIIQIGNMLGFHTIVLEDRPSFADNARRAKADEVICDNFLAGLEQIEATEDTYYVIVTRGHRYDSVCLEQILKMKYAYVGMMGSRARARKVLDALAENGSDAEKLGEVHTPIGLSIGAKTPEEIAVSIMAEIIEIKNKRSQSESYPEDLRKALMEAEDEPGKHVLATIISRRGSAPREVGTKMLVCEDGTIVGTIGGGCVEAEVYRRCLDIVRGVTEPYAVMHVDMSGKTAEDEGMVCGGNVEVFVELI